MHTLEIALRFRDMDELGHLTHSVYHEFLAEGRIALMEQVLARDTFPFVLANVTLDYRHEVRRADGIVVVETDVSRLGTKSITLAQRIRLRDGTLCAEGSTTLVAWDPEIRGARAISDDERAAIESL